MMVAMETISVNQFRDQLRHFVEIAVHNHEPLVVTRRNGENFIVLSETDWLQEQETLYILQNQNLMQQIAVSSQSFAKGEGRRLSKTEQDEIDRI